MANTSLGMQLSSCRPSSKHIFHQRGTSIAEGVQELFILKRGSNDIPNAGVNIQHGLGFD
jgi:hypothetical protein